MITRLKSFSTRFNDHLMLWLIMQLIGVIFQGSNITFMKGKMLPFKSRKEIWFDEEVE